MNRKNKPEKDKESNRGIIYGKFLSFDWRD
jgi:hypothetical protein